MHAATDTIVEPETPRPVAAVITEWRRNSHADVLLTRLLEPENWGHSHPFKLRLAAVYADQFPENDLCRPLCEKHGVPIFPTIRDAVGVGTKGVPVAGVMIIGEHGQYAQNSRAQRLYPRRRLFDDVIHAFRLAGQRVPVFSDKHLSYDWLLARWMYDVARHENVPFLTGSSVPVAWRAPAFDLPRDCTLDAALGLGYGDIEAYGFHALEGYQCLFERSKNGARGPARVRCVTGAELAELLAEGTPRRRLIDAIPVASAPGRPGRRQAELKLQRRDALFLLDYGDFQGTVAMIDGFAECFAFACEEAGAPTPRATVFALESERPFGHFGHLLKAIEHLVLTGRPPYPVERTLITTGTLDALMQSRSQGGITIETPHLAALRYTPADWPYAPGDRGTPA